LLFVPMKQKNRFAESPAAAKLTVGAVSVTGPPTTACTTVPVVSWPRISMTSQVPDSVAPFALCVNVIAPEPGEPPH
jgi:hypothetical protein